MHDLVEADGERVGLHHAGLEAAHVEQVADDGVEAVGLLVDGLEEVPLGLGGPVDVVLQQAGGRRLDGGERRAQVVGHGPQDGGAEPVALGRGGGLGGLALEPAPFEGVAELGGEGAEHPLVVAVERRAAVHEAGARRGARPGRGRRRSVVDVGSGEGAGLDGRSGGGLDAPAVAVGHGQHHAGAVEGGAQGVDDLGGGVVAADQAAGGAGQALGLESGPLGVGRPLRPSATRAALTATDTTK